MSYMDNTSPTGISNLPEIKVTTPQDHPPRVRQKVAFPRKPEPITPDSQHLSKGNSSSTFMCQRTQCGMEMKPEHPSKGQKRKCPEEGGMAMGSEEPGKARKRVKQEQGEPELPCEEPGKGQMWRPQEGQKTLKPGEGAKGPQTQEKSVNGGKGRKRPYCVMEESVQKHQIEKRRRLSEHFQQGDHVNSDLHGAQASPLDLRKIKGCVEGQSHGSETTHFDPKQSTVRTTREYLLPHRSEKRSSEKKLPDIQKTVGIKLEERSRQHLGPAQISVTGDSKGLLNNKMSISEPEKDPLASQKRGRAVKDDALDVSEDMEKEINDALGPGPQDEILSIAFKLQITRKDIRTLKEGHWLNDEVINFYMNLLMERSHSQGYPDLHVFNTFFYPKLKNGGYSSVKRWTRGVNLFAKDLILVPIHQRVHWSLVVIDLRKKSIVYMDSMGQKGENVCEIIFQYLRNESKMRRNIDLNPSAWRQYSRTAEEIPQQLNGSDCGVFTCKYADYISRDQPVGFSQQHMPAFRKRMVWEILHHKLLL